MDSYISSFRNGGLGFNLSRTFKTTKNNNKCDYCEEGDSIEHHLYYCTISNFFWNQVKSWMISYMNLGIELTVHVCEVLFRLPTYNNPDLKLINFLIIIGQS